MPSEQSVGYTPPVGCYPDKLKASQVRTCRHTFMILVLGFGLVSSVPAQTNLAVLTADGAWTWYNDPRSLFYNGILYFGYVRSADGRSVLSSFNLTNGVKTDLFTSTRTEVDDHDVSGLLVKQDGKMLAIYARHGADQFFAYRLSTTTNPATAGDWGAEQTISSTGAGLTYSNPYQLTGESNRIYNFARDLNFNPTVFTSTNGGSNWSTPQLFIKTGTGSTRPYVKYSSDSTQRVDFQYTDGHPRDVTNSLYHLYYQGGWFYKTDGTPVTNFANLPILHDTGQRGSVIYQYSDAPSSDPNDHIATGRAWSWETTYQSNGWPVGVFTVQVDNVTGPNWYDDRIYYYYARWTGTNWQKRFIAQAGRPLYTPETDYAGGICIDPNNPNTVYISSNASDPFNLADITNVPLRSNDRYEIWRGITSDGGLTFAWTQLTTNSTKDNLRPYIPRRQTGTPVVLWFRGSYNTYTDFHCEVVGLFNNPIPSPPTVGIVSPVSAVSFTNLNDQLRLIANAADDGLPGALTTQWTTLSGPTNAVFANAASTNTTAEFPLAGTYVLRISASDTLSTATADLTVNAGPATTDGADGTRGLWLKFDETSGTTAADSSGNGNNGGLTGGTTWLPTGGMRNGAIKFDGTSGLVTVADSSLLDNTSAFTLAYWLRADAYPGDSAGLVCKRNNISDNNAYTTYLKAADKKIYVDIDTANNRFSSATLIQTGAWYHVAVVFNGSLATNQRAALWINGSLDVTVSESSAVIPDYTSSMMIANTHPGAANWFNGRVDDVRFYRRALSAGEIAQLALTNTAPSVVAGPISTATNSLPATLTGTVVDDEKGGALTTRWSKVSGPGNAVFANSNATSTSVTCDHSGAYVLRLAASDTQAEISSDLAFTVAPNPNVFEDWIAQIFPGSTNAAVIGMLADPDNDRAANLLEFALGLNPNLSDALPFTSGNSGLPIGRIQNFSGTNYLSLLVRRPIGRLGITYTGEVSSNLFFWTSGILVGLTNNGDGSETALFRDFIPMNQAPKRFIWLKVQAN